MTAYLIHCSLIWAIALFVYELWLGRTTFHGANRWYLNASALLGLLLPLYRPAAPRPDALPVLQAPLRDLAIREQQIEAMSRQANTDFNLGLVLLLLAAAGALLQLLRIMREARTLLRWRRQALRTALHGYEVRLTGEDHGPFSAFGAIYLSDAAGYDDAELRFILAHEAAHLRFRHSIDKCAMLLMRCIFWWHPLAYMFYSRLCLVQEFQADEPLRAEAAAYGRFLIDESLAVSGSGITHQFFHSPLKTRIRMLQRFATRRWHKAGYLAALALLAGGSFLWTNKSLAHREEKQGNVIIFNGNRFETGVPPVRTKDGREVVLGNDAVIEVSEVVPAGKEQVLMNKAADSIQRVAKPATKQGTPFQVRFNPIPLRMNGEPIYESANLDRQAGLPDGSELEQTLISAYMPSLAKLPDGRYELGLKMLISDAGGKLVYYRRDPVSWLVLPPKPGGSIFGDAAQAAAEKNAHPISKDLLAKLSDELESGLASLTLNPPQKDGKAVIGYVPLRSSRVMYVAEVKNGAVRAVPLRF